MENAKAWASMKSTINAAALQIEHVKTLGNLTSSQPKTATGPPTIIIAERTQKIPISEIWRTKGISNFVRKEKTKENKSLGKKKPRNPQNFLSPINPENAHNKVKELVLSSHRRVPPATGCPTYFLVSATPAPSNPSSFPPHSRIHGRRRHRGKGDQTRSTLGTPVSVPNEMSNGGKGVSTYAFRQPSFSGLSTGCQLDPPRVVWKKWSGRLTRDLGPAAPDDFAGRGGQSQVADVHLDDGALRQYAELGVERCLRVLLDLWSGQISGSN